MFDLAAWTPLHEFPRLHRLMLESSITEAISIGITVFHTVAPLAGHVWLGMEYFFAQLLLVVSFIVAVSLGLRLSLWYVVDMLWYRNQSDGPHLGSSSPITRESSQSSATLVDDGSDSAGALETHEPLASGASHADAPPPSAPPTGNHTNQEAAGRCLSNNGGLYRSTQNTKAVFASMGIEIPDDIATKMARADRAMRPFSRPRG